MITLRAYHPNDAKLLEQVRNQCGGVDGIDTLSNLNRPPTAIDIHKLALGAGERDGSGFVVAEIDTEVVGYASIRSWSEGVARIYLHDGHVLPRARQHGVGTALVLWAEERIRVLAELQGVTAAAIYGANAPSSECDRVQLLTDNGYAQAFSTVEMELLDLSCVPNNPTAESPFTIRSAEPSDIRKLWALNNVVYAGRAFVGTPSEADFDEFSDDATDLSLFVVAENAGEPVAFVSSRHSGSYAEVTEVSVHPGYRRRGLAGELLRRNLTKLRDTGVTQVRLHTNGEDVAGARSLYEKFGFTERCTHLRYRKDVVPERVYDSGVGI